MICDICNKKEGNVVYNNHCEDCYIESINGNLGITVGTNFKAQIHRDRSRPENQRAGMRKTRS